MGDGVMSQVYKADLHFFLLGLFRAAFPGWGWRRLLVLSILSYL